MKLRLRLLYRCLRSLLRGPNYFELVGEIEHVLTPDGLDIIFTSAFGGLQRVKLSRAEAEDLAIWLYESVVSPQVGERL